MVVEWFSFQHNFKKEFKKIKFWCISAKIFLKIFQKIVRTRFVEI